MVKFEVLGQEFPLHTDAPEDEVNEILELVRTQIENSSSSSSIMPAKLAVLASLNLAGKYVRLRREFEKHKMVNQEKITALTEKIESIIKT